MNNLQDRMFNRAYAPTRFEAVHTAADAERIARLHFHIKSGDYFATLATILGFLEETVTEGHYAGPLPAMEKDLLRSVRKDLMHLNEYYMLAPRDG